MILVGIVVIYLVMDFGRQVLASHEVHVELRKAQAELAAAKAEQKALEERVRHAYSEEAVHIWAREQGMARENEQAVTILAEDTPPAPSVRETPRTTPASVPARRVWWDLFFAER
jgi:hypothetical protein